MTIGNKLERVSEVFETPQNLLLDLQKLFFELPVLENGFSCIWTWAVPIYAWPS